MKSLSFPIFSTGPLEKQGFTFVLCAGHAHMVTPDGQAVQLLTDPHTGFHWLPAWTRAKPTLEGRKKLVEAFLSYPNQGATKVPRMPVVPTVEDWEEKPSSPMTTYDYDQLLHMADTANWGERATKEAGAFPVTRSNKERQDMKELNAKNNARDIKQKHNDGVAAVRAVKFDEVTVDEHGQQDKLIDRNKWPRDPISGKRYDPDDHKQKPIIKYVKLKDDEYMRLVKNREERDTRRPIWLRLPAVRLHDSGASRSFIKLRTIVHETLGHLEMPTL
jgi:hypothetical protein